MVNEVFQAIRPQLEDFGLTDELIAAARDEEQKRVARSGALKTWVLAGVAICVVGLGVTVVVRAWSKSGALVALGELVAVVVMGAVVLLMAFFWLFDEYGRRPKTKNEVLLRLEQFNEAVRVHEAAMERRRREFWEQLDGISFEHELAAVLRKANYTAEVTPRSGDDGVDIWAEKDGETIAIQCKRYGGAVGPAVVRELHGVLMHLEADRGIVATTGYFTEGAIGFVEDKPIELWTLDEILQLQCTVQKAPLGQAAENQ